MNWLIEIASIFLVMVKIIIIIIESLKHTLNIMFQKIYL